MHVRDDRAPRLHVEGTTVRSRRWPTPRSRAADVWDVNRWEGLNLYFGGVQAVHRASRGALDAAGDPRRGGVGLVVE